MDIVELPTFGRRIEGRTVALAIVIYAWWGLTTWFWRDLPAWALVPLGAWVIAWQMNLQHEIIHGHPTPWRAVNEAIGVWPLSLWLPFSSYRKTHIRHHEDANLTDPFEDPESYYWTSAGWRDLGPVRRAFVAAQSTLAGRLLLGPAWMIGRFVFDLVGEAWRGEDGARRVLFWHGVQCAPVVVWVIGVCDMPLSVYVAVFVYPGMSLALLRSFAEHRAASEPEKRTAIVENAPILGLLFLNNNLHVAHHLRSGVPWYQIPDFYRLNREALVRRNGGLVYDGYADVVRRYAFSRQDRLVHPDWTGRAA